MSTSNVIYIVLGVFLIWMMYKQFAPIKGLHQLNEGAFRKKMDESRDKQLLDVREPHEFKHGHIPGAINIPLSQLVGRVSEIPQNKQTFLYCQSGMRSKQAARKLLKSGFPEVTHLVGGISAWSGKKTK
ncbi:rhodanese-like domain-containing protein [Gorillibacterium massiliense]|uniref:rhodanese-like domain-containing protein n=1 Tax=Gorillibacterium massiliense TaxID=1280390 RepID=UPI0004B65DCF|nr:rhodanese-like domain-containing protein [Gorillibacterium massiliense]